MKNIILASTSPRRRELLKKAGIEFIIVPPEFNENILNKSFSYDLIENIALNKGLSILHLCDKNSLILSADTVVVYDNIVLGKPKDFDDALRMLKMLSGNTHRVVTSVCVIDCETGIKNVKSDTSKVTFNKLNIDDIKDYILKFKPYDKAGSYGIQELNETFIKDIEGEYDNIVGLPIKTVNELLNFSPEIF